MLKLGEGLFRKKGQHVYACTATKTRTHLGNNEGSNVVGFLRTEYKARGAGKVQVRVTFGPVLENSSLS